MRDRRARPRRIFIGLTEIAGYYGHLARGFEELGIPATFVDLSPNPYKYRGSNPGALPRLAARAAGWRTRAVAQRSPLAWLAKVAYRLALASLLAWALLRHDTFIYGFRTSFFWFRELPLLHVVGKRIVFVFNGSDARPSYIDGAEMDEALGRSVGDCIEMTAVKKREIGEIERWADLVVSHALYLHLFRRPAAGFQVLGIPGPAPEGASPEPSGPLIRVLHSPSRPGVKGTGLVRQAITRLRDEGVPIELIEMHGVPNELVHEEIRRCHFVVDQVFSDGPMLGFAREAALYGRPAVVGSYGWDEIRRLMPDGARAPVEACHPDDLEAAIRRLASDGAYRRALGGAAREFVQGWTSRLVARRYLRLLRGGRPAVWMCDPSRGRYLHGVGLSEERARRIVGGVIEQGGLGALQIDDKGALRRAFAAFGAKATPDGHLES